MVKIEELNRKRSSAKKKFDDEVKSFEFVLEARPEIHSLEEAFGEVKVKYKAVRVIHDGITDLMVEADIEEADFTNHDIFITEIIAKYGDLLSKLEQYRRKCEVDQTSKGLPTEMEPKQQRSNLERIKVPQFSGNIKHYRTWKRIFEDTMKRNYENEGSQLARLIEAIQPPLRYEIECFTTTKAIWEFLDKLFGDDKELIKILMNDIKTMKPLKVKDAKSIRNLVATVRGFILRMEDVGASDEAKSRYVFADILAKLTVEDQRAYARSMIDTKKIESLHTLLEYLEEEAKIMASSQSDQRSSKIGIYPVNVDGGYNGAPGCGLGCSQQHGLGYCPAFKKMKVKEKWEVVIQSKRCKKCLRTGHRHQQCSRKACDINSCGRPHHYLLHKNPKQVDNGNLKPDAQPFKPDEEGATGTGKSNQGLAMVDSGSNKSLIRKEFADKLGLVGETKKMKMYVAGGGIRVEDSAEFDLKISPCYDEDIVFNVRAYSVKQPCQAAKTISKKDLHLNGGPVDILLGTDLPEAHRDFKVLAGNPGEPIAKKNIFGWSVLGNLEENSTPGIFAVETIDDIIKDQDIKKLIFQDQLRIKPTGYCTCSEKEMRECAFIRHVRESTRVLDDGRIEVRMPWKPEHTNLPNNRSVAVERMVSKERQLVKKGKLEVFNKEVKALVDREVVIKLKQEEVNPEEPAWYLPIGEVESPNKTTKCRLVFDAAAKMDGLSPDDALEKGPCLMNSLFDVLIGWRQNGVAFAGDNSKMFNEIAVHPDDQKYHRLLWRDGETDREPAMNAINPLADRAQVKSPEAARILKDNTYVDDVAGSETPPEIDQDGNENPVSLLGHQWNKKADSIALKSETVYTDLSYCTKRKALGVVSQLWDLLGLMAPVTIRFRIDLQNLYQGDEVLPPEEKLKWQKNIGVGDLVLEIDGNRKRGEWQMALVEEVFPGGDRKAKIRTSKGVCERPIAKLCLIATRQELDREQNETLVQQS
ncbi:Hypothetical predicted protein [Paramuricea clavata]|uniref:DUF5641 domain-containing protein n=1 Tax=Paramuricea clavata TaxID=317549 RepID=A0A7D9HNH4_PARCT|nr:Hypothetical predicted protein [Paramuricea clavata]